MIGTNLVIENIKKRQSVRLFEQKPIPKNIINTIIEAGNLAPSTGNMKEVEEGGERRKLLIINLGDLLLLRTQSSSKNSFRQ